MTLFSVSTHVSGRPTAKAVFPDLCLEGAALSPPGSLPGAVHTVATAISVPISNYGFKTDAVTGFETSLSEAPEANYQV